MKIVKNKVKTHPRPVFKPAKQPVFALYGCEKRTK